MVGPFVRTKKNNALFQALDDAIDVIPISALFSGSMRVPIHQTLIDWSITRARADMEELSAKFAWLGDADDEGTLKPTMKQLERFAAAVRVPLGFLFLPAPPIEEVPIPDFRTMAGAEDTSPSPELLDSIYMAQTRQDWYRSYVLSNDLDRPKFVGSVAPNADVEEVAGRISDQIEFSLADRSAAKTWAEALSKLVEQTDDAGVLVMVNGVVGNNTHRKLDPNEFRGFALSDPIAPLVFVNGADTKSAQMFTIIHELAHIWLGESALTDSTPEDSPSHELERWCDKVAAEVLVPTADFKEKVRPNEEIEDALARLAREYKVSTLVILRRLYDIESFSQARFWQLYEDQLERLRDMMASGSGGNFYNTQNYRVSRRFARALLESTFNGRTLYGDALRLLSVNNVNTLKETAQRLEVV
ncbi:MAG: ImmA/IrrE family metallo-endopeptidase [Pseudomonadota bacterium]